MTRVVSVVVPVPALGRLDYEVPRELPVPETGTRVLVPLGARPQMTGCVVDRAGSRTSGPLKALLDVLDDEPMLPADVVGLALWVGEYYACGAGQAVWAAMPPRAWVVSERRAEITGAGRAALAGRPSSARRRVLELLSDGAVHRVAALEHDMGPGGRARSRRGGRHALLAAMARDGLVRLTQPLRGAASAFKTVRIARLTPAGRARLTSGAPLGRRQREALERLDASGSVAAPELTAGGVPAATIRRLAEVGAVTIATEVVEREPSPSETLEDPGPPVSTLTPGQR